MSHEAVLDAHIRHNQRDLSLDGLLDTGGSDGGTVVFVRSFCVCIVVKCVARIRDEDGGCGSASLLDALLDIGEDGEAEVLLAGLLGVGSADDLCACGCVSIRLRVDARERCAARESHTVLDRLLRVEAAMASVTVPVLSAKLQRRALTFPACR